MLLRLFHPDSRDRQRPSPLIGPFSALLQDPVSSSWYSFGIFDEGGPNICTRQSITTPLSQSVIASWLYCWIREWGTVRMRDKPPVCDARVPVLDFEIYFLPCFLYVHQFWTRLPLHFILSVCRFSLLLDNPTAVPSCTPSRVNSPTNWAHTWLHSRWREATSVSASPCLLWMLP